MIIGGMAFWIPLFFAVAFLYAAVGHGGASGYLALLSIFSVAPEHMKPVALVLNLIVSGIAFVQFYRQGYFLWKLFLPIAVLSMPMAYLGGLTPLTNEIYLKALGVFLLLASVLLNVKNSNLDGVERSYNLGGVVSQKYYAIALFLGAIIGYLSGLLGIGGGILLSPVLLLLGWTNQKKTAALGAAFIFVNSASGLLGYLQKNPLFEGCEGSLVVESNVFSVHWLSNLMILSVLIVPVIVGGTLGSWYGAKKLSQGWMRSILSVVLAIAAIKLLL